MQFWSIIPAYEIRSRDLKLLTGLIRYFNRTDYLRGQDSEAPKWARIEGIKNLTLLSLYNLTVLGGAALGALKGLEVLLK